MLFEVIASLLYFPMVLVNLIGLLFSFVFVLNLSSFSIITTAENFVFNRYSAITRRVHLPKHRTPRQFTPSICFMGGTPQLFESASNFKFSLAHIFSML